MKEGIAMVSRQIMVKNKEGFHLRPATNLCKVAVKYKASVMFQIRNATVNAKSVLNVLAAQVKQGDEVTFICDGPDEEEALNELVSLVERNMDMGD